MPSLDTLIAARKAWNELAAHMIINGHCTGAQVAEAERAGDRAAAERLYPQGELGRRDWIKAALVELADQIK